MLVVVKIKIIFNGETIETKASSLYALAKERNADIDNCVIIKNGFQTNEDKVIKSCDIITIVDKGKLPDKNELEAMMVARHSPLVHDAVKKATVGIAGLGGLGSNIAISLARTGIGHLVLVDFDIVEPTNLNRQQYFISHLGMKKNKALKDLISNINPYIKVTSIDTKITDINCTEIFKDCEIVCEAFDKPEDKAMLVSTLLSETDNIKVISASGMAGYESCNTIITQKINNRLIICGDMITAAMEGTGLMAPRVAVCANHQANAVIRLILDKNIF